MPGWIETTEDKEVNVYSHQVSPFARQNAPTKSIKKTSIWTRELPEGFPQRIGVGSKDFYDKINMIEKTSGGKRSKRKTLKKKKHSGKKLN